jgi:arsenite methyltransferase
MQEYLKTKYDLTNPDIISVIDDLPLWSAPFGLKLLDTIIYRQNLKVLDIGSGNGFPIIELSQRLGETCKVYGIDPWQEAVDRIRLKIKMWEIKNVELFVGKAESLNFEDNYFDLIVSNNGTNNVEDEEMVFAEISRVAKKGAQLVLTVNLPETMKEFYQVYEKVLAKENKTTEKKRLKDHIFSKRKPLSYTKNLIEKVGFEIKSVFEDSFNLRFTNGSAMLNHSLIKFAFSEPWKNVVKEKDINSIFAEIEKELNEVSQKTGEINLTIPWVCVDGRKVG